MAVQRHGKQHRYQIRAMRLTEGDVLLLQADEHGLAALTESGDVLIVEGVDQTVHRAGKMPIAVGILALVVVLAAAFHLPLSIVALGGAALMLLTRVLRMDEAVRALDVSTLLLLAGTIPLGIAMTKTGMAGMIVNSLMDWVGGSSPRVIMSSLYLLTAVFTSFISNNATAVLLTPLAVDLAGRMGIDPRPLLMAIAFGASACFSTPIGYQTNAIVMGPGGYTFGDYLRIGVPLTLIMWITATILLPMFWPF
jgi:di/tricarboxylate transporter